MSQFLPVNSAAPLFGYPSGPSLLKAFRRGVLPKEFLLRVGARGLRVDVERVADWLRTRTSGAESSGRGVE